MDALLKVEDLKVSYGGINAIKGVDLHVNQGELVALIGANGAGKSSSLKVIAGLLAPAAGVVQPRQHALPHPRHGKLRVRTGGARRPHRQRI